MPESTNKSFEQKCERFFKQCNNGEPITPGQLARVIRQAVPAFQGSDEEIAEMFLDVDKDKDSLVSWEEFSAAVLAKDVKEVTRAELEEEFKSFDKDGSGKISRDEIKGVLERLNIRCSEGAVDNLMSKSDSDGDGGIDFKEFLVHFKDLPLVK